MNDQSRSLPENILRIKKMKNSCSGLLVFFAMDFRPLWDTWVKEVALTSLLLLWRNEERGENGEERRREKRHVEE